MEAASIPRSSACFCLKRGKDSAKRGRSTLLGNSFHQRPTLPKRSTSSANLARCASLSPLSIASFTQSCAWMARTCVLVARNAASIAEICCRISTQYRSSSIMRITPLAWPSTRRRRAISLENLIFCHQPLQERSLAVPSVPHSDTLQGYCLQMHSRKLTNAARLNYRCQIASRRAENRESRSRSMSSNAVGPIALADAQ